MSCKFNVDIKECPANRSHRVDAMLLVVPIWMLKDAKISLWRKIRVIFLLSLGLFVMGMAIARCILSIGTSVQVALSSVWAQREAVSPRSLSLRNKSND
jgi:hypothetical protein